MSAIIFTCCHARTLVKHALADDEPCFACTPTALLLNRSPLIHPNARSVLRLVAAYETAYHFAPLLTSVGVFFVCVGLKREGFY